MKIAAVTAIRRVARTPSVRPRLVTDLGALYVEDCLTVLRTLPDDSVELVITSPPYDGQPKYGNGERYDRAWYQGFLPSGEKSHGGGMKTIVSTRYAGS